MRERILFLTGRLAQSRLEKVLQGMGPTAFDWSILNVGVKVAALMTEPILLRRLPRPINADRVVVPGRCRADLAHLTQEFGAPFERGPDELKDLPEFFGKAAAPLDLSRYAVKIFAEIVDASQISLEAIIARAEALARPRRRRDRSRLPAGHALPPSRGNSARIEGKGFRGQRRFGGARRTASGRSRRRRLSPQPHRAQCRHRRRDTAPDRC